MTIARFGQKVRLEVFGANGEPVFDSDGLRVDFDIVNIPGFSRATFKVWNLSPLMVGQLMNGERYCTLTATLHDDAPMVLAEKFFVSNALEETKLPSSITTLYCFSHIRKELLEKQLTFNIKQPSLRNIMRYIKQAAKFTGEIIYKNFPEADLDYLPPRVVKDRTSSVEALLKQLSTMHRFKYFTQGNDLVLMYQPTAKNLQQSDLFTAAPTVVLDSNNLSSSPKIGVASLEIVANLDADIEPTAILDIAGLVTAAPDADENTLQIVKGYLTEAIGGFTKYQAITVHHSGSNYTRKWDTVATATSPQAGKSMPTTKWFK